MRSETWRLTGGLAAVIGAAILLFSPGAVRAGDCGVEKMNLKAAAEKSGVLTQMMAATKLAGLDDPEVNVGTLTLFAPSDAAFAALPQALRDKLFAPENREHLTSVLLHHAVPGEFPTERLLKAKAKHYAVNAIDGTLVEITTRRGIDVEGATIVTADIVATDGIIHIIDKVLIPPTVLSALDAQLSATEVAATGHVPE